MAKKSITIPCNPVIETFQIADNGNTVFTIHPNGNIELGEGINPNTATRILLKMAELVIKDHIETEVEKRYKERFLIDYMKKQKNEG